MPRSLLVLITSIRLHAQRNSISMPMNAAAYCFPCSRGFQHQLFSLVVWKQPPKILALYRVYTYERVLQREISRTVIIIIIMSGEHSQINLPYTVLFHYQKSLPRWWWLLLDRAIKIGVLAVLSNCCKLIQSPACVSQQFKWDCY